MTATIHEAYAQGRKQLEQLDLGRCEHVLGLGSRGEALVIPFYNETYNLSDGVFRDRNGRPPTDAVGLVLCRYLLNCPDAPLPDGRRLTFREMDGAGPLVSNFATNTNKLVTSAFGGDPSALEAAAGRMGGTPMEDGTGYDLAMVFSALPRVRVFLQFNAADDLFPAQCSLLFNGSAQRYLDMQALFILGTYLAGGLVRRGA